MSYWAVAQTVAQREDAVAERIDRLGFDTLAPKAKMRINGRMDVRAVFPGYVFVEIDQQWYEVRWCIGVIRLIMNGERPAQLPDWEIKKIRDATGKNGLVKLPKAKPVAPKTKISVGAEVRIITGQFRGLHALYEGSTPKECELVLLDLLGRKVPVELATDDRLELVPDDDRKIIPLRPN